MITGVAVVVIAITILLIWTLFVINGLYRQIDELNQEAEWNYQTGLDLSRQYDALLGQYNEIRNKLDAAKKDAEGYRDCYARQVETSAKLLDSAKRLKTENEYLRKVTNEKRTKAADRADAEGTK